MECLYATNLCYSELHEGSLEIYLQDIRSNILALADNHILTLCITFVSSWPEIALCYGRQPTQNQIRFTNCVLLFGDNSLIPGCLWLLAFVLNNTFITSSYSTWIFCRGVSGLAPDCHCDVWCLGLTTCLLHVSSPFGNRFLNTSWAVGLTDWIVYLHFFVFWHMQLYVLIHHIIFGLIVTS